MMVEHASRQPIPAVVRQGPASESARSPRPSKVVWTPAGVAGVAIVGLLIFTALFGQFVVPTDPNDQDLLNRLAPPYLFGGTSEHLLGTDGVGTDLLARLVAGARISLIVGLVATLVAGTIGVALGLLAGYAGGIVAAVVTFRIDVQMTLPFVVVGIAVVAVLGNSLTNVIVVLAVTGWVA